MIGKEAPQPPLINLATSLPLFLHLFATTIFPCNPLLGAMSDEKKIDRARSLIMEGLNCINEVGCCIRFRASLVAMKELKFEKATKSLEGARS